MTEHVDELTAALGVQRTGTAVALTPKHAAALKWIVETRELCDQLIRLGIPHAVLAFEGSGDEGMISIDHLVTASGLKSGNEVSEPLRERLEEWGYATLHRKRPYWENDNGGSGTITLNTVEQTVDVVASWFFMDATHEKHSWNFVDVVLEALHDTPMKELE